MTDVPPAALATGHATVAASAAAGDATVVARLWLATLQDVVGRVAHDVKNLLNGVAVNLEVVRSRASRPGVEVSAVKPFAESAAEQFERLSTVTDALLTLARPAREPVDVVESWNTVAALAAPASAGGENAWTARPPADGADTIAAGPGEMVRLAIAATAVAAAQCTPRGGEGGGGPRVSCTVTRAQGNGSHGPEINVTVACGAAPPPLRDGVAAAVAPAGIRVAREKDVLILTIPAAVAPTAVQPVA